MIELKKVNKAFGEKEIIKDLDLIIPDGQKNISYRRSFRWR